VTANHKNLPIMIRKRLYKIIFEHDTKPGKLFDVVLLWLILISVIVVITESIPEIHLF
jgi:voltage-gated potassium channel